LVFSINPSNLHEFSKQVIEFYADGNFDIINELRSVQTTLTTFSEASTDPIDIGANTIDDVILDMLINQYTKVKESLQHTDKPDKPKKYKEVK